MEETEAPHDFLCPITHLLMEHPVTTTAGITYEYEAIASWLKDHGTDPMTRTALKNRTLVSNRALRSQIQLWLAEHPDAGASLRNGKAAAPPPDLADLSGDSTPHLDQICRYLGQPSKSTKIQSLTAFGRTYELQSERVMSPDNRPYRQYRVRCDGGAWVDAPNKAMFATPKGLVFFDPAEIRETRLLPTEVDDGAEATLCKFSNSCNRSDCDHSHPFVCKQGAKCPNIPTCKFLHPPPESIVPLGAYPRDRECRYRTTCSNRDCHFAHPLGRLVIPRVQARVCITHSLTLAELPKPEVLHLDFPPEAERFQFQGEFAFFFVPHSGAWAKGHPKTVIVHRFNPKTNTHQYLGTYSLKGHYCNSVVGADRHLVFSFWPYEEEAIRVIWESVKVGREMEKELRVKEKEIRSRDQEIVALEQEVDEKNAEIVRLGGVIRKQKAQLRRAYGQLSQAHAATAAAQKRAEDAHAAARAAKYEARQERQRRAESDAAWRRRMQDQERSFNERMRMRDPIHIYALTGEGTVAEDWTLVLDYHKGAHNISLGPVTPEGTQRLEITERDKVFAFDLLPVDYAAIKAALPVVPHMMCPDF